MKLVLEYDRPDSEVLDDAGFPTTQRFRAAISIRIPWVERGEGEDADAHWEQIAHHFHRSLAFELLGSGKNLLGSLVKTLCANLRAEKPSSRLPSPFGSFIEETEPSPPSSDATPPATPTLPSGVAPPSPAPESGSDHVDVPSESG